MVRAASTSPLARLRSALAMVILTSSGVPWKSLMASCIILAASCYQKMRFNENELKCMHEYWKRNQILINGSLICLSSIHLSIHVPIHINHKSQKERTKEQNGHNLAKSGIGGILNPSQTFFLTRHPCFFNNCGESLLTHSHTTTLFDAPRKQAF